MNALMQYIQPPSGQAAATAATPIISNKLAHLMKDPAFLRWLSQQDEEEAPVPAEGVNALQSMLPEPITTRFKGRAYGA